MSTIRIAMTEGNASGSGVRATTAERVVGAFQRDPSACFARMVALVWGGFWTWFGASVLASEWRDAAAKGALEFQAWLGGAWPAFLTVALMLGVTAAAITSRRIGMWAMVAGGVAASVAFPAWQTWAIMAAPQFVVAGLLAASLWRKR